MFADLSDANLVGANLSEPICTQPIFMMRIYTEQIYMEPDSAIPSCPMEKPQSKVAEGTLGKKLAGCVTIV